MKHGGGEFLSATFHYCIGLVKLWLRLFVYLLVLPFVFIGLAIFCLPCSNTEVSHRNPMNNFKCFILLQRGNLPFVPERRR